MIIYNREQCPVCRYYHRIRRDGKLMNHRVYHGGIVEQCKGGGLPIPLGLIPVDTKKDEQE